MTTIPEGAQLSEDGYYWWDGADWQPVPDASATTDGADADPAYQDTSYDGGGEWQDASYDGADGGSAETGYAMFELSMGGIGSMADPDDNPDNHQVPHHDAGLRISEEILNVGAVAGVARLGIEVDGTFVVEVTTSELQPGQSEVVYASLGRLEPGTHEILVYVNPGSGANDHDTVTLEIP